MKPYQILYVLVLIGFHSFVKSENEKSSYCPGCNQYDIPIDVGNTLNQYELYSDYIQDMIDISTIDPRDQLYLLANKSSEKYVAYERSVSVRPKPAACIPELSIVSLRPENETDPTMVFFPSCTRVRRCGGCCSHKLLSCQPTEVQSHAFEVIKSQYTGGTRLTYRGKELQIVDEHLKCKCDCKIREEDCNPQFQRYDKSQCKCYCTNIDDQHKCLQQKDLKIWDSSSCTCSCRNSQTICQTGFHFNDNICDCISNDLYWNYN